MRILPNVEESYAVELVRKSIHLCSLSIPVVYSFAGRSTMLWILVPLTLAFGCSDLLRLLFPAFGTVYMRMFGWLLRPHERNHSRKRLTGATYVLLSAVLCIVIFPKVIFITAFAILIVSDTLAALVGRKYGRVPFLKKSRAGAIAFFLSALVVVAVAPKAGYQPIEFMIGLLGALVGTVVESLSIIVDDNISIPITIGATMWVLYALLLPHIPLFPVVHAVEPAG